METASKEFVRDLFKRRDFYKANLDCGESQIFNKYWAKKLEVVEGLLSEIGVVS